jgi:hypothetical protein
MWQNFNIKQGTQKKQKQTVGMETLNTPHIFLVIPFPNFFWQSRPRAKMDAITIY